MTVVSSFSSRELDPARSSARGVRLLAEYLRYAESSGTDLMALPAAAPTLDAFQRDVQDELARAGLLLEPRLGTSGYRIEFAVRHPVMRDRFILAIDADGPEYFATPTTRDRDRLRQEHLERLGWRYHRIWSTHWFTHRQAAVEAVLAAYREAIQHADRAKAEPTPAPAPRQPTEPVPTTTGPASSKASRPARSLPRPLIRPGLSIDEYSPVVIVQLVDWIESDGLLRTEEELVTELMAELGFRRRGANILAGLSSAIRQARARRRIA
jgi:hypothetical protein